MQLELSTSASLSKLVLGRSSVQCLGFPTSVFANRFLTFVNRGCESMDLNKHADLQDVSFEDRCSVRCFDARQWECL